MRAIAHGWTPSRMSSPPSRAVAQEFVNADRKYSGGFAENRYWTGGLAAMDEITAGGKRGSLDLFKWQEGGDVDYPLNQMMQDMQAREKKRIENTLGSARGGHVNYYQKGGAVRPGHAEDVGERGPNPHDPVKEPAAYKYWETRFHKDPPPPKVAEEEPEDVPWYMKLAGYGSEKSAEEVDIAVTEAEKGEAYGGRVNYPAGGLAIAAPAGGVPPWISPTGSGPGYMDEPPPGYQFGGIAARYARPPAAAPATDMGRGNVIDPNTGVVAGGMPGGPGGGGIMDRLGMAGGRFGAEMRRARGMQTYQDVVNRGEGGINPRLPGGGRMYGGDGGGGVAPGNAGTLGGPGYGEYPLGSAGPRMDPSDPSYRAAPPAGGGFQFGKPRPGPGMMPPGGEGGGIPGGPRVPPNMRGYLQKQRMQNRPPRGPVGGGGNRVGMADQQGALSRAMQRGTGRPPMSRRMGFGRAGPTR